MSRIFDIVQQFRIWFRNLFLNSDGPIHLTGAPRFFPTVFTDINFSLKINHVLVFFDVNVQYYLLQNPSSGSDLNKLMNQQSTSELLNSPKHYLNK